MLENEILYHYTSFDAFCNIVRGNISVDYTLENNNLRKKVTAKKAIWAGDSRHLNDATEFEYGLNLAKEVYEALGEKGKTIRRLLEGYSSRLQTFVFSLSKEGDLLSQWRAYCPNGGVSIGFSRNSLERLAEQQRFKLVRCIYKKDEQVNALEKIANGEIEPLEKGLLVHVDEEYEYFYNVLMITIASFKHHTFSEEREFRLVSETQERPEPLTDESRTIYAPQWRATRTMPVRYTEFSLSNLSEPEIKKRYPRIPQEVIRNMLTPRDSDEEEYGPTPFRRVIVGPSAHQNLVEEAVRECVNHNVPPTRLRHSGGIIKVSSSKIPYRA